MLVALLILRVFAVPALKRYDSEVGLDATLEHSSNQETRRGCLAADVGGCLAADVGSWRGSSHYRPDRTRRDTDSSCGSRQHPGVRDCRIGHPILYLPIRLCRPEQKGTRTFAGVLHSAGSAAFFWSEFEQKQTSFNLFANNYTHRMIGDIKIPAVWFQSINALLIILLAPVFSWAWPALVRNQVHLSSMTKFSIGILFAGAGFGLMMLAA